MQIKHFTALNSIEIALKDTNITKSKKKSKSWLPNGTKYNNTSSHIFLDHRYAFGLSL